MMILLAAYMLFLIRKILFVIIIILLVIHANKVIGHYDLVPGVMAWRAFFYLCFGSLKTVCLESSWSYTFKVYIRQVGDTYSFIHSKSLTVKEEYDISKFYITTR